MIDTNMLEARFARIGARLKRIDGRDRRRRISSVSQVGFDIQSDRQGEYFEVIGQEDTPAEVEVLDVQPSSRHFLLLVREQGEKHKFLCGHDERHWFVAAVPEKAPVGTVLAAKEALKPVEVQAAQARAGLGSKARDRRKNAAYRRQGEWFFLPTPDFRADEKLVLRNEPITRSNGAKPHWCEFCERRGGEIVYVSARHFGGLSVARHAKLLRTNPEARSWGWQVMTSNAEVHVRGRIRHADHKTITLNGWHQVLMNTENQSKAMRNVVFLD